MRLQIRKDNRLGSLILTDVDGRALPCQLRTSLVESRTDHYPTITVTFQVTGGDLVMDGRQVVLPCDVPAGAMGPALAAFGALSPDNRRRFCVALAEQLNDAAAPFSEVFG